MGNNDNIISLAERRNAEKSNKAAFSSLGVSTLILASDLIWFFVRRTRYDSVKWWEIMFLVISGTFFFFSLLGILFSKSTAKFNAKVANEPLIAFDKTKDVFIVESFVEFKKVEFRKEDVLSVKINPETDEATLNYTKNGKNKTLNIGYADYTLESSINNSITEYKTTY